MNTHETHLDERAIEALACGRDDLATESERAHALACPECAGGILAARELASSTRSVFREALAHGEPDAALIERWVQQATAATAPSSAQARSVPTRASAWAALTALGVAVAGFATQELPSLAGSVRTARDLGITGWTLGQVLFKLVPGGRIGVLLVGALLMGACAWAIRRLGARDSAFDVARAARRLSGVGLYAGIPLVLSCWLTQPAGALDFQGDWSDGERLVTLTVERAPASEVLNRAAAAAGMSVVATLPEDPAVTLSVREVPFKDVLSAVLGDAPVTATRTGKLVVIRATTPANPTPTAPTAASTQPSYGPVTDPADDDGDRDKRKSHGKSSKKRDPSAQDRVTFGDDVVVKPGEKVNDVVTTGGDADIAGEVFGDVVTTGGDVHVRKSAVLHGDIVTLGGDVEIDDGAVIEGQHVNALGGSGFGSSIAKLAKQHGGRWSAAHEADDDWVPTWVPFWLADGLRDIAGRVAHYTLLFLLALLLLSLVPERLSALERTLMKAPGRALALGFVAGIAAVVSIVVMAITIIGIPAALVVALALPIAVYLGLAAVAASLGAALPIETLRERPIAQLASGVGVLFVLSLVPVIGSIGMFAAATIGFGAVLLTRFSKRAVGESA